MLVQVPTQVLGLAAAQLWTHAAEPIQEAEQVRALALARVAVQTLAEVTVRALARAPVLELEPVRVMDAVQKSTPVKFEDIGVFSFDEGFCVCKLSEF